MTLKNALLYGIIIVLVLSGAVYWYETTAVPVPPPGCDTFYYGDDGGIWGRYSHTQQSGRIIKPDGKWLWANRLKADYGERWQPLSSSAFYDELTPCPATGRLYVTSVWSKDGGDANAAIIIEASIDGRHMSVIAEHVAPYPPADQFFQVSKDGHFVVYNDDYDLLWQYDTLEHTRVLIEPSAIAKQTWLPSY